MEILRDVPLSQHTTFRLGGPARFFITVSSVPELREAIAYARDNALRFFILGGGSNTLFSDDGFSGVVIRVALKGIEYEEDSMGDARCTVAGGEVWDELVANTTEKGLWGLENLSAIPGTVGASPVQNIGAYGVEVKDVIDWVEVLDTVSDELHILTPTECVFGYRDSIFKHELGSHYVVTRVAFRLKTHPTPQLTYKDLAHVFDECDITTITPHDVRMVVTEIRGRKLPDPAHVGTAGSFFKNPTVPVSTHALLENTFGPVPSFPVDDTHVKIPLAYLLERLGWKGKRVGTVGCWAQQPLCLVHYGKGTTHELLSFADIIIHDVHEHARVTLEPEVRIVS